MKTWTRIIVPRLELRTGPPQEPVGCTTNFTNARGFVVNLKRFAGTASILEPYRGDDVVYVYLYDKPGYIIGLAPTQIRIMDGSIDTAAKRKFDGLSEIVQWGGGDDGP